MHATMIAAGLLGLLLVVLSVRVSLIRRRHSISMGDGGNAELLIRSRAQANCAEYAPIGLLLLFLAEQARGADVLVVALAAMLVLGRIAHPIGMALPVPNILRVFGTVATWGAIGCMSLVVLWAGLAR